MNIKLYSNMDKIEHGLNVLSCFDGLSGGQLALEKSGIKVNQYFASEIDKYAIAVAKYNFPDMVHLGDVKKIDTSQLPKIDLMLAGSPCTDLSFAGLGKGLVDGEQSSLFFDWWKLVKELKPTYIFLENVRMKKEYEDMISDILGFNPIAINSSLVSAQNRYRLYWFGIRDGDIYKAIPIAQPKDKGIVLGNILETGLDKTWTLSDKAQDRAKTNPRSRAFKPEQEKSGALLSNQYKQSTDGLYAIADIVADYGTRPTRENIDKASTILARDYKGFGLQAQTGVRCIQVGETAEIKGYDVIKRVYSPEGKAPTLTTMQGGHREPKVATTDPKGGRIVNRRKVDGVRKDNQLDLPLKPYLEVREDDKTNCLSTVQKDNVIVEGLTWRKLTPKECARLQTVPDNYCTMGSFDGNVKPISNSQQYKMLGNGWTIDVIAHILQDIRLKGWW